MASRRRPPPPDKPFVEVGTTRVNPSLAEYLRPISSLTPAPDNARLHSERNVDAIKRSIGRWGFQAPIVVRPDGEIIAGHGRLEAAKALGWTTVPVIEFTGSRTAATAFAIADNRTAELAEWDEGVLLSTLQELRDGGIEIDEVGFDQPDFDALVATMSGVPDPPWTDRGATTPDDIGDYNPDFDTFEIRISEVTKEQKDEAMRRIAQALQGSGLDITVRAKGSA